MPDQLSSEMQDQLTSEMQDQLTEEPKPANKRGRKPGQINAKTLAKQRQAEAARQRFTGRTSASEKPKAQSEPADNIPPKKKQKTIPNPVPRGRPRRRISPSLDIHPAIDLDAAAAQSASGQSHSTSQMQHTINLLSGEIVSLKDIVHDLVDRMKSAEVELALIKAQHHVAPSHIDTNQQDPAVVLNPLNHNDLPDSAY